MFEFQKLRTKLLLAFVSIGFLVSACSGIPVRSIPRLLNLQNELLVLNPADFKLALQIDGNLVPRLDSVPLLEISLKPTKAGGFEPYSKKLPMRFEASASPTGLTPASKNRKWLIYSLSAESQIELSALQLRIKRLMAEKSSNGGGSLAVGIHQDGLAPDDTRLANTRWDSWLQTDLKSGYFELWSGTVGDLKAASQKTKK
jgi:hypothetical protein